MYFKKMPSKALKHLHEENLRLKKDIQLLRYKLQEDEKIIEDILISNQDYESLRQIFDQFDTKGKGKLSLNQLSDLYHSLGETLTKEEVDIIFNELTKETTDGELSFKNFVIFWIKTHRQGKQNPQYNKYRRFKTVSGVKAPGIPLKPNSNEIRSF